MDASRQVLLALALLAVVFLAALVILARAWRRERLRVEQLLAERDQTLADARRESVQRSRSTLKGQIAEQLAPLLPGFRYSPAEARFLGDPVDYVVFNGYGDVRDNGADGSGLDIVLLEVKQGSSSLSTSQKAIARSVEEGRVRFEVLRIADDGTLSSESWRPRGGPRQRGSGEDPRGRGEQPR